LGVRDYLRAGRWAPPALGSGRPRCSGLLGGGCGCLPCTQGLAVSHGFFSAHQGVAIPKPQERRWAIRVAFIRHPSAQVHGTLKVWLVDLSASGARITLDTRLDHGSRCTLDLPPELGSLTLSARVVWSSIFGGEQTAQGERHIIYQSGLAFVNLTAEQQAILANLLEQFTPRSTLRESQHDQ
jgi:hypothetical protein